MQKILLDTHVVLWYADQSEQLPQRVAEVLLNEQNQLYISAATW